jgi:hypothetical protein
MLAGVEHQLFSLCFVLLTQVLPVLGWQWQERALVKQLIVDG